MWASQRGCSPKGKSNGEEQKRGDGGNATWVARWLLRGYRHLRRKRKIKLKVWCGILSSILNASGSDRRLAMGTGQSISAMLKHLLCLPPGAVGSGQGHVQDAGLAGWLLGPRTALLTFPHYFGTQWTVLPAKPQQMSLHYRLTEASCRGTFCFMRERESLLERQGGV